MSKWLPSEKPRIEPDGWIHKRPADPRQMRAAKWINAAGFGIGMLLCGTPHWDLGLLVIGLMVFTNLMGLLDEQLQAPYAITMCPRCHTTRRYSRYQEVCAGCGYRPKKEGDHARTAYRRIAADTSSGSGAASHSNGRG